MITRKKYYIAAAIIQLVVVLGQFKIWPFSNYDMFTYYHPELGKNYFLKVRYKDGNISKRNDNSKASIEVFSTYNSLKKELILENYLKRQKVFIEREEQREIASLTLCFTQSPKAKDQCFFEVKSL